MAPKPFFINNVDHLFRGDSATCDAKNDLLNTCFVTLAEEPQCDTIGNCFEFQPVDDECLLTKKVVTVFKEIFPALTRGEGEEPKAAPAAKDYFFMSKPMKNPVELSGMFYETKEFKDFTESECVASEVTPLYRMAIKNMHDRMKETVASIDLGFEHLMWATLFSSTEVDRFGDPIWGTHDNGFASYKNLYTGQETMLMRTDLTETKEQATDRIHKILMSWRKQFEDMRNPITKKFMYCKENCVRVLVSPCVFEYLIETLEIEEYIYKDGCCANRDICGNDNTVLSRFLEKADGTRRTNPFFLKGRQFQFEVCPFFDKLSFEYMIEQDKEKNNFFKDVLDLDLDNAVMMIFPERIKQHKLLQKHFYEVPGNFVYEERPLARFKAYATYGRGWFDIVEGTGMILHTGK